MAPKRPNPSTTAKTITSAAKTTAKLSLTTIKTLGNELLTSALHTNNLKKLIDIIKPTTPPKYAVDALISVQAYFCTNIPPAGFFSSSSSGFSGGDDVNERKIAIYWAWVRARFDELVDSLFEIIVSPLCEEIFREVALDTLMEFVKLDSGGKFNNSLYLRLIRAIVYSSEEVEFLLESLASSYFKYIDVRYFTFTNVKELCNTLESKNITGGKIGTEGEDFKTILESRIKKIHFILSHVPAQGDLTTDETWSSGFLSKDVSNQEDCKGKDDKKSKKQISDSKQNDGCSHGSNFLGDDSLEISLRHVTRKMKPKFTNAWMSFLRLPLPLEVYKEVLANLHQAVIPYHSNPVMLSDFLIRSFDIGGVVSVMALSGLFILMTKNLVDYPTDNFYKKLYTLLTPSTFMTKYRAKFFELLDASLKSSLFPKHMAAAFTKKLSRLSLKVPPHGLLIIIALVHNLLRNHTEISVLVHKESSSQEPVKADKMKKKLGVDPFDDEETDLEKTNAMSSSLWEIDILRHHYCPAVSRFVLSLEEDLKRAKTSEMKISDFSSGSYGTIFNEEMRRRVKQVPLAHYNVPPSGLFSESLFPGWAFNNDKEEVV